MSEPGNNLGVNLQLDEFYLNLQQDGSGLKLLSPQEVEQHPFPGLRPFKTSEFQLFMGRDGQAEELMARLRTNRFLSVLGSSGTGKSSLIRAGLIPQLLGGYLHAAGTLWNIAICRPGKNPIDNLGIAFARLKCPEKEDGELLQEYITNIQPLLEKSAYGIIDVQRLLNQNSKPSRQYNLLVIVDQFEELFRYDRRSLKRPGIEEEFVNLLLKAAVSAEGNIYIVTTMRSEFLGDCIKYRGLPEAINKGQYLVPQLNRNELEEVITAPVHMAGKEIDPGLVELLINEIEDNKLKQNLDQLPILQHALMRTYAELPPGETTITRQHYKKAGHMAGALDKHANETFDKLASDNENEGRKKVEYPTLQNTVKHYSKRQKIAMVIFQSLTDKARGDKGGRRATELKEIYRIAQALNATESEVDEVINHFRRDDVSFLMPPFPTGLSPDLMIDISHESLMRNWTLLNMWVDEEAKNGSLYETLDERRRNYETGKEDDFIGGGLLDEIIAWRSDTPHSAAWAARYYTGKKDITDRAIQQNSYNSNIKYLQSCISDREKKKRRAFINDLTKWGFAVATAVIIIITVLAGKLAESNTINKKAADAMKMDRDSIGKLAQQLKLQKDTAEALRIRDDTLASNAISAKLVAEKQKSIALQQTTKVNKLLEQAKLNEAKLQTAVHQKDSSNQVAQKAVFGFNLTRSSWWAPYIWNDTLTEKYIVDSLYEWTAQKDENWRQSPTDSIKAASLITSLDYLSASDNVKFYNYSAYLDIIKLAYNTNTNPATSSLLHKELSDTRPYAKKIVLSNIQGQNPGLIDARLIKGNTANILLRYSNRFDLYHTGDDKIAKTIFNLPYDQQFICLSPDATHFLCYNTLSKKLLEYVLSANNDTVNTPVVYDLYSKAVKRSWFYKYGFTLKGLYSSNNKFVYIYEALLGNTNYCRSEIVNLKAGQVRQLQGGESPAVESAAFNKQDSALLLASGSKIYLYRVEAKTLIPDTIDVNNFKLDRKGPNQQSDLYNFNAYGDSIIQLAFGQKDTIFIFTRFKYFRYCISDGRFTSWNLNATFSRLSPKQDYVIWKYGNASSLNVEKVGGSSTPLFYWHNDPVNSVDIGTNNTDVLSSDASTLYLWDINKIGIAYHDIEKYADPHAFLKWLKDYAYNLSGLKTGSNYSQALDYYQLALKYDSNDVDVLLGLGYCNLMSDNNSAAYQYLHKAYLHDSNSINVLLDLVQTSLNLGLNNEALYLSKKAVALQDNSDGTIYNLSLAQLNTGQYDSAITTSRLLLTQNPNYYFAYSVMGQAYANLGNVTAAKAAYKSAISSSENDLVDLEILINIYLREYDYDSAGIYINKALNIADCSSELYALTLVRNARMGKYQEADWAAQQAIRCGNLSFADWDNIVWSYIVMSRYDEAGRYNDLFMQYYPNSSWPLYDRADILIHKRQFEQVLQLLNQAYQIDSDNIYFVKLASYYGAQQNKDATISALDNAVKNGYDDYQFVEMDKSFMTIKDDERFKTIMAKMKELRKKE